MRHTCRDVMRVLVASFVAARSSVSARFRVLRGWRSIDAHSNHNDHVHARTHPRAKTKPIQVYNDIWKTSDGSRWTLVMANGAEESFPKVRLWHTDTP